MHYIKLASWPRQLLSIRKCTRDGWIVIFCQIPDSVNRRLISSRFWIRIRIFDLTIVYTYKNYSKSRPMLYFPVIFNLQ